MNKWYEEKMADDACIRVGCLNDLLVFVAKYQKDGEEEICRHMVCDDDGLTLAGSDALSDLSWEVREILSIALTESVPSAQFWEKLREIAYPDYNERSNNEIAEALLDFVEK